MSGFNLAVPSREQQKRALRLRIKARQSPDAEASEDDISFCFYVYRQWPQWWDDTEKDVAAASAPYGGR